MIIKIFGKPIARKTARTNQARFYDPQRKDKEAYRTVIRSQYKGTTLTGPLIATVLFVFPHLKKTKDKTSIIPHAKKPDTDNCLKHLFDCIKNILVDDDAQIAEIHVRKVYGQTPRTVLQLEPYKMKE